MALSFRTPMQMAAFAAAIVASIALLLSQLFNLIFQIVPPSLLFLVSALLFLVSFLVFYYVIRTFVYQKIKQLYRTLYFLKPSSRKDDGNGQLAARDLLSRTQEQAEAWARDRSEEYDRIKQLADYRRQFLGNVSHELKTPIFNIQGYVLTLLDGGLEDPTINKEYLRRTEKSVERLIAIVNDLEGIAKLEAGEMELRPGRFDVVELAREVMDFLEIKAQNKKTQLFFEGRYERPINVYADRERIRQVLINLIDNSIKYRRKKHEGRTGIAFFDMDDHVLVEVTDNGIGLAPHEIPRVFERFYRTEGARMRSKSGSGLGLAIVKHIIEAHDQTISIRSKENEGTTFGFTLGKAEPLKK